MTCPPVFIPLWGGRFTWSQQVAFNTRSIRYKDAIGREKNAPRSRKDAQGRTRSQPVAHRTFQLRYRNAQRSREGRPPNATLHAARTKASQKRLNRVRNASSSRTQCVCIAFALRTLVAMEVLSSSKPPSRPKVGCASSCERVRTRCVPGTSASRFARPGSDYSRDADAMR